MKEALKLALKELETWKRFTHGKNEHTNKAITAIKEALANHLKPRCFADFQPNHEHDRKCQWCAVETECKTGMAQLEQEPVAYIHRNEYNEYRLEPHDNFDIKSIPFNIDVPLFKSPQRTWVGLTTEDYNWIFEQARTGEHAVQLSEAKLKEKNT